MVPDDDPTDDGRVAGEVPLKTSFTSAVPDLAPWQQGLSPAAARELGLRRPAESPHQHGWGRSVRRIGGVGASDHAMMGRAVADRDDQMPRGSYGVAVLSLKGGVGKTTTAIGLGATFASSRGDRVIAVDANPDFGTLAQRGPSETDSTVRNLLTDRRLHRYADVRRHTSQNSSRLEILASERDPAISEAFSEQDYCGVHAILDRFYDIVITDCGTGVTHSAMRGVLHTADALVVVASPAIDSARSALATLDWLQHHGYEHLVPNAIVVINSLRPGAPHIDLDQMTTHFRSRVRSVLVISHDRHLAEGGEVSLDMVNRRTRHEYLALADAVADAFRRSTRTPN